MRLNGLGVAVCVNAHWRIDLSGVPGGAGLSKLVPPKLLYESRKLSLFAERFWVCCLGGTSQSGALYETRAGRQTIRDLRLRVQGLAV